VLKLEKAHLQFQLALVLLNMAKTMRVFSTNFRNSLVKFVELQDFTTKMILIAPNDKSKINKYQQEIEKAAFSSIKSRVQFYNYDFVENLYNSQLIANQYSNFLK